MIRVCYAGDAREKAGCTEETYAVATLGALLAAVRLRHGRALERAMRASLLTVDGVRVEALRRRLLLPEGCTVGVFPLCGGG